MTRSFPTARRSLRRIARIGVYSGFDPRLWMHSLAALPAFLRDMRIYAQTPPRSPALRLKLSELWPVLHEKTSPAGEAHGQYFHTDLWAAKKIYQRRPAAHTDVASRLDGFVAHLLVFMPVTVVDIRPMHSEVPGLQFIQDDATRLASFSDNSIDSLSCLHAAEHFGLGRYSDPVDPHACFTLIHNLQRVLAPGGRLYFAVPIGRERVEFNAHRIFDLHTILESFSQLNLVSFSFVDDEGHLQKDIHWRDTPPLDFGCGLFEFTKAPAEQPSEPGGLN